MWPLSRCPSQKKKSARRIPPLARPRLEALEDRCLLSAGALDPTFGNGGIVTTSLGSGNSDAYASAIQADGKIVVAGDSSGGFTVARYNTSGTLDASFGNGGSAAISFGRDSFHLGAVAVDGSGRIVLAGYAITSNGSEYFALTRLSSNGQLDTSFGSKGKVLTAIGGAECDAVAIQSNGDIVAAGFESSNVGVLARYNSNGSLDSTFGSGGLVKTTLGAAGGAVFHALALQSDGKILAGGDVDPSATSNFNRPFAVARFNSNGTVDSTFGSGGVVTTSIDAGGNANWETGIHGLAIQSNGMIAAAGTVTNAVGIQGADEVALTRYDTSGNLDPTFGSSGVTLIPSSGNANDAALAVALQSDGKIITAGWHNDNSFEVERFTSGGVLDGTFGNGGTVATLIGQSAAGYAMALQSNGDIVLAGNSYDGTRHNFALARYLPSDPEIASFTANPNPVMAGNSVTVTASNITDGNPGSSITQVAIYLDSNNDGTLEPGADTLLGYATQTSPGVWTFSFSTGAFGLTAGTYKLFAQAQDNYGVLGDPDALTLTVQ